jgi:hypothetical protein
MKCTQILSQTQPISAAGQPHSPSALQLFALARGQELRLLADRCTPHGCRSYTPLQRPRGPRASAPARGKESR